MERLFSQHDTLPPHPMEHTMLEDIDSDQRHHEDTPTHLLEVYMDDFIGATNAKNPPFITHLSRSMLHSIHCVFPPPAVTGHDGGDPISEKKLGQGDGTWSQTKEILGWIFDGKNYTLKLSDKKCTEIIAMIRRMLRQKRASLHQYQKLAGKLQHASFGLPGGTGLFSPIQMAMLGDPQFINLSADLKQALSDWKHIIRVMMNNPTSVLQLISDYPDYIGYSNTCKLGAGGVWCSGIKGLTHIVWKVQWPQAIQDALITEENPSGKITINDLELAGMVLNWLVLEYMDIPLLRRIINRKSMKISLKEMILKRWKNAIKSIRKELKKSHTWKELK
jgi:hypothetical protein